MIPLVVKTVLLVYQSLPNCLKNYLIDSKFMNKLHFDFIIMLLPYHCLDFSYIFHRTFSPLFRESPTIFEFLICRLRVSLESILAVSVVGRTRGRICLVILWTKVVVKIIIISWYIFRVIIAI